MSNYDGLQSLNCSSTSSSLMLHATPPMQRLSLPCQHQGDTIHCSVMQCVARKSESFAHASTNSRSIVRLAANVYAFSARKSCSIHVTRCFPTTIDAIPGVFDRKTNWTTGFFHFPSSNDYGTVSSPSTCAHLANRTKRSERGPDRLPQLTVPTTGRDASPAICAVAKRVHVSITSRNSLDAVVSGRSWLRLSFISSSIDRRQACQARS